jgi:hypothetical protein
VRPESGRQCPAFSARRLTVFSTGKREALKFARPGMRLTRPLIFIQKNLLSNFVTSAAGKPVPGFRLGWIRIEPTKNLTILLILLILDAEFHLTSEWRKRLATEI